MQISLGELLKKPVGRVATLVTVATTVGNAVKYGYPPIHKFKTWITCDFLFAWNVFSTLPVSCIFGVDKMNIIKLLILGWLFKEPGLASCNGSELCKLQFY